MDITNDAINDKKYKKSFASGLNFFKLFWIFYIGCFAGVIIETLWCIVKNGVVESRTALIFAPLNPVYGFGAVLMTICFLRFSSNKNGTIFLGCMIAGGIFEYLCSLSQEIVFGTISWSYPSDSLGIFQRTSLIYCVFWGILGIVWVRGIYPYLSYLIEKIPNRIGKFLTYFLLVAIIFDMIFSSFALLRQLQRREGIPATNSIQHFYDNNYNDSVLKKIYPNMVSVR